MLLLLDQRGYEEVGYLPPQLRLGEKDVRIKVDDLESLRGELSAKFKERLVEIEARGVTLEIRVKDPDGYVVAFWQWAGADESSAAG